MEIASEYRYRNPVITPDTLFVTISQSGETADTLAALRNAKRAGYLPTLTICNVAESSMVRESELVLLTRAGPEIGVASTKAFTTQLTALAMMMVALAKNGARRPRRRTWYATAAAAGAAGKDPEVGAKPFKRSPRPSPTSGTLYFSAAARCRPSPSKAR